MDAQIDWKIPAGPGSLDLNILANFTDSFETQLLVGSAWQEFAGTIDGTQNGGIPIPDWKTLTSLTYRLPSFEGGVRWRHSARDEGRHLGHAAREPGAGCAVL